MRPDDSAEHTILGRFAQLGVDLNGLIVPARSIESTVAQYARNLFVHNDDDTYRVSLVGSATAVHFRGRHILLTTQHQLRGVDETRVSMLTDSGSHLITSGGCRRYDPRPDSDSNDIVAFDFSGPCRDWPELKRRFFPFDRIPPNVTSDHVLGLVLSGYAAGDQAYELYEKNHLGLVRRQVVCQPLRQPGDPVLLTVRPVRPLEASPDGMSGGSAFVIQLEEGRPRAYFAGLILRGGQRAFHILKSGYVRAFLESVFPEPPSDPPVDVSLGPDPAGGDQAGRP